MGVSVRESENPFWEKLDGIVHEKMKDPQKKIIIYAHNVFMVEKMLARFASYGCARIDGSVDGWAREQDGELVRDDNGRPGSATRQNGPGGRDTKAAGPAGECWRKLKHRARFGTSPTSW